jgi:putative FmdB family regulatory protein
MPIYAYRCESCGHAKDVLQKVSDPLLTTCPACHAESFKKQLTAAGFQLKGNGWYATDFRGGNGAAKPDAQPDSAKTDGGKADGAKPDSAPAPAAAAPAASPAAGGCGSSCACH